MEQNAIDLWQSLIEPLDGNLEELRCQIPVIQLRFEQLAQNNGGDRWDGQKLMVRTGIQYFYDNDLDSAKKMRNLMIFNQASFEVQSYAEQIHEDFPELGEPEVQPN